MADLGAVGRDVTEALRFRKVASPLTYVSRAAGDPKLIDIDATGAISGTVLVGGVPRVGVSVGLYYHPSMRLIERTTTAADGTYSFVGLNRNDLKSYFVVAKDPNDVAPHLRTAAHDHLSAG